MSCERFARHGYPLPSRTSIGGDRLRDPNLIESVSSHRKAVQVELATVHPPVPHRRSLLGPVLTLETIDSYYGEEGTKPLAASRGLIDEAEIRYNTHILVGQIAETLVEHAEKSGCKLIYMGTVRLRPSLAPCPRAGDAGAVNRFRA